MTCDDHFSRHFITKVLKRSTRKHTWIRIKPLKLLFPYLTLHPLGFTSKNCHQSRCGLLPHSFTLTHCKQQAVYFLLHFPYAHTSWPLASKVIHRCSDFPPAHHSCQRSSDLLIFERTRLLYHKMSKHGKPKQGLFITSKSNRNRTLYNRESR